MSHLTKILTFIKSKAGLALIAGTLVFTPSGVALAHGNNDGNHRGDDKNHNRWAQASQHRDKDHRKNDDNKQHNPENNATCEERQASANQKVIDYKNKAQQRFNGLSMFLANQQSFVTTNSLAIENYDALSQKAEEAKTSASNALANTQPPTIDCNKSQKKDSEAVFRAIHESRKAMKNFESSVQQLSATIADKIAVS